MNFLVEPKKGTKWPTTLPKFTSREEAIEVCKDLCRLQFMHRSEKRGKGDLAVSRRHARATWYKSQWTDLHVANRACLYCSFFHLFGRSPGFAILMKQVISLGCTRETKHSAI